ncbi:MAG: 50S ribosome-binding GTPase [archaeon]|nr:50S ribosome-binding GTPase [archaeon]MCR4323597.1 50S ribosome-binding GTPase [Nanoarchaeota archaeon]
MVRVRYSFGSRHTGHMENIQKQRVKYPRVMKEVIDISEIVLEILDARYIDETRNIDIEEDLIKKGKKIIFVLNKADLVDVKKIEAELPKDLKPYVFVSAKTKQGSRDLRERIRIEAKRVELPENMKRVHVGIIGYPNAGKSSIINLVTRRSVTGISKQAGYTRGMQKVRMTDKILILDTPGVIPDSKYSSSAKAASSQDAKVGARTYSHVKDPEDVINYLMKDYSKTIEKFYKIDAEGDVEILIEKLGKKMNYLKKGGQIDSDRTARLILKDWQEGKIRI